MWHGRDGCFTDDGFPCDHLVTTRALGDMKDPDVRRDFCEAAGIAWDVLTTAEQVHGTGVTVVDLRNRGCRIPLTDGLITQETGIPLVIFTADCLPVFFAADRKAAGVVHAGWRGLAHGILGETVSAFSREFGIAAGELAVSIGPHIRKCCYEVSRELKELFGAGEEEPTLDLTAAAERQLGALGVGRISSAGPCTAHEKDLFFSYRREKTSHRIMSLVQIKR